MGAELPECCCLGLLMGCEADVDECIALGGLPMTSKTGSHVLLVATRVRQGLVETLGLPTLSFLEIKGSPRCLCKSVRVGKKNRALPLAHFWEWVSFQGAHCKK